MCEKLPAYWRKLLYAAAGDHGLFAEALGAYILLLNKRC
jgi:hypothetical protein